VITKEQKLAITSAYCDLIGAKQARDWEDIEAHNWKAHQRTIRQLEKAFPLVITLK
jgi:hypothetical protein